MNAENFGGDPNVPSSGGFRARQQQQPNEREARAIDEKNRLAEIDTNRKCADESGAKTFRR